MFLITYFDLAILFFIAFISLDIFYSKVFLRYKSAVAGFIVVCFVFFFVRVLLGIEMGVWEYGVGTSTNKFLNIPLEEYLYMMFAPYGLIVTWEAISKFFGKKRI